MRCLLAVLLVSSTTFAGEFSETLAPADRDAIVTELRAASGWLLATQNNASLSQKQRALAAKAAQALTALADATGKDVTRKRRKSLAVLRKLLKATRH